MWRRGRSAAPSSRPDPRERRRSYRATKPDDHGEKFVCSGQGDEPATEAEARPQKSDGRREEIGRHVARKQAWSSELAMDGTVQKKEKYQKKAGEKVPKDD